VNFVSKSRLRTDRIRCRCLLLALWWSAPPSTAASANGGIPEPSHRVSFRNRRRGWFRKSRRGLAINFVCQADGRLFLVGLHNTFASASTLAGRDYPDRRRRHDQAYWAFG
jgi:hypothetical protein